jgi:Sec-independent protein translocase protein TatA
MAEEPSETDDTLARIERHMARGNAVVTENARAFTDLRAFLGEQTEVLGALVTEMRAQGEALREFRGEMRAQGEEIRAQSEASRREFREEGDRIRREFHEEGEASRREFREEGDRIRREFHEEMAMARAALVAILDRLQGGGGAAPAT